MKTTDSLIRAKLSDNLNSEYANDSETLIIHELGLNEGIARIDLAVLNGHLHGYEIKSDSDNLRRLPKQLSVYNRIFDFMTIVCGESHLQNIKLITPPWWGISIAKLNCDHTNIIPIRRPLPNLNVDVSLVVKLIWRDEAIALLRKLNQHKGFVSKPKHVIWKKIVECLPPNKLKKHTLSILKTRVDWRSH